MSYIEKLLQPEEKIICRGNKHAMVFSVPLFWFIISMVFLTDIIDLQKLSVIPLFISLVIGINSFVEYFLSETVLTNRSLLIKLGFIRKTFGELSLYDIKSIQIKQTFCGKIFNYGSIEFCDTKDACFKINRISNPFQFKNCVQKEVDKFKEKLV